MSESSQRPPFLLSPGDVPEESHRYPNSEEPMAASREIGKAAGLTRIGLHLARVEPGRRTSYPHAEEDEEEFVFVVSGEIDAWIDGHLHRMRAGDLAAFPAGTGICHSFINNGTEEAILLIGGEASKRGSRIFYPRNPERRGDMIWNRWWEQVPLREQGPHDGKPDAAKGE